MPRIAYLGPEGTFTEAALIRMASSGMVPGNGPSHDVTPVPTDSTAAALAAVRADDADYACVPIENSIEGSVLPTLDSLSVGPELQSHGRPRESQHHGQRQDDRNQVPHAVHDHEQDWRHGRSLEALHSLTTSSRPHEAVIVIDIR